MSLRTSRHDAKAAAKAGATSARQQARRATKQARRATKQVTPLAKSGGQTAKQGVYRARVWAAPRVERTGHVLEERVAPRVSGMLAEAARRMEPAPPKRRRRWLKALAGIGMLAAGGAAAVAAWRNGRRPTFITKPDSSRQPEAAPNGQAGEHQAGEHQAASAETADINGQVRTP